MTDNMKNFLEEASKDQEFIEKLKKAKTPEAVIAMAKEKGFALTAEDLNKKAPSGELSDDELEAVAGGRRCACFLGGGGTADYKEKTCACVAGGGGEWEDGRCRCACVVFGSGDGFD